MDLGGLRGLIRRATTGRTHPERIERVEMSISEAVALPEDERTASAGPSAPLSKEEATELLHAASVLLSSGSHLGAVKLLHREIARAGDAGLELDPAEPYTSQARAEECQRQLWEAFVGQPASSPPEGRLKARPARTRVRVAVVLAAALGLLGFAVAYVPGALDRWRWQNEYPEGAWLSRYYPNMSFEGTPVERYDIGVKRNFHTGGPARGMLRDRWSARWDTCLVVKKPLELPLRLSADDSSTLLVDDVPQMEVPRPGKQAATIALQPGTRHIQVDFVERQGVASIRLDGLAFGGTEDYGFQRPILEGEKIACN